MFRLQKLGIFFTLVIFFITSSLSPAVAAMTYLYDANGNMTSDGTRCFEYNQANQLKKVKKCSDNQTIAEYVYDYQGNRIVKKVYAGGTLQKTIYSPNDEYETAKIASNGATQNTSYYFANDQIIAKKNPDGSKNYYHNDHLGSSTVITNQSGALVEETKYDPWGEVKTGGTKSKFGYTGQEKDLETGLNYYNARYYDSHIRRFTQPDNLIPNVYDPQSLNRYAYVNNNPVRYTDPSGNCPTCFLAFAASYVLLGMEIGGFVKGVTASKDKSISGRLKSGVAEAQRAVQSPAGQTVLGGFFLAVGLTPAAGKTPTVSAKPTTTSQSPKGSLSTPPHQAGQDTTLKGSQNPFTQQAALNGIKAHKNYQYGIGYDKEFPLKSGKRVDAINFETKHVYELKPDSPAAIRRGEKQLEGYLEELNQTKGQGWTGEIITYPKYVGP